MSSLIAKNIQIGADTTATNNFTIYQPATPNGTLLIGNGNTGITSSLMALTSAGNFGLGTSSPIERLQSNKGIAATGANQSVGSLDGFVADYSSGASRLFASRNGVAASTLEFWTTDSGGAANKRATIDSAGNLGLGVTPSAWSSGKAIQVNDVAVSLWGVSGNTVLSNNFYYASGDKYATTSGASQYAQFNGKHIWNTAPSGTAGNAISFTQAMTLDADGRLAIGTTTPLKFNTSGSSSSRLLTVFNSGTNSGTRGELQIGNASTTSGDTTGLIMFGCGASTTTANATAIIYSELTASSTSVAYGALVFGTANGAGATERARIDSSGNWTVGSNGGTNRALVANPQYTESVGWNGAVTSVWIGKNNSSGRSVSAAGTLNASGADYAEYMTKAGEFTIVKGGVVGINADGKLTNVFADAVSFCVKSTDPSYVGGDGWGVGFEDDAEGLEAARQRVDRIAFAGQVPVNVMGAIAGQYIIPINDNGAIKGEAVSSPTFEQYQQAVGKVIAIEADGRARIIVKVA